LLDDDGINQILKKLTSRTGKSAADLAEEMEANPRTVYRDLEALQVAGFPIYTDRVDGKNLVSFLFYAIFNK
jgi:predicted DNA-binding transcriptional regulator YafY